MKSFVFPCCVFIANVTEGKEEEEGEEEDHNMAFMA